METNYYNTARHIYYRLDLKESHLCSSEKEFKAVRDALNHVKRRHNTPDNEKNFKSDKKTFKIQRIL